jgi:hypothetical protein
MARPLLLPDRARFVLHDRQLGQPRTDRNAGFAGEDAQGLSVGLVALLEVLMMLLVMVP